MKEPKNLKEKGTIGMDNYFNTLNSINFNDKTETKNGLTYLSWSWAWAEIKKLYPDADYEIEKFGENKLPYVYDENTGYMCFTNVTINGQKHEMWLPVMDGANKAMKAKPYTYKTSYGKEKTVEAATMFDINKTIMRCLVKNLAMHGLGLYIFAGEDLPESEEKELPEIKKELPKMPDKVQEKPSLIPEAKAYNPDKLICEMCKKEITSIISEKTGFWLSAEEVVATGLKRKNNPNKWKLCAECQKSL